MMKHLIMGVGACALLGACAMSPDPSVTASAEMQPVSVAPPNAGEIERLNDLAGILIDAEELYKDAAEMPDNKKGVSKKLAELAMERKSQREYLQARIQKLGGAPDTTGEFLGTGHRAFAQMRTVFDEDSEVAIEEVLRGERYILEQINDTLETNPSEDTVDLLTILKNDVEVHIDELNRLDRQV